MLRRPGTIHGACYYFHFPDFSHNCAILHITVGVDRTSRRKFPDFSRFSRTKFQKFRDLFSHQMHLLIWFILKFRMKNSTQCRSHVGVGMAHKQH